MAHLLISEDLFSKLREFDEFEKKSNEELESFLRNRISHVKKLYSNEGALVIWNVLDRFALHIISTNRVLDAATLRKAVADLEKCEIGFDRMEESDQQTLLSFQKNFYDALVTSSPQEYEFMCGKLVETNHKILHYLIDRVIKPSTVNRDKFEDRLVVELWEKLTGNYNEDFIRKRMKRVKKIVSVLQPVKDLIQE